MKTLNALFDKKGQTWRAADELITRARNENRELTPEEASQYEAAIAEVRDVQAAIDREQSHNALRAEMEAVSVDPRVTDGDPSTAQGREKPSDLGRFLRATLRNDRAVLEHFAQRDLSSGVGSEGGFLVPEDLSRELVDLLRARMVTRAAGAQVKSVTTGSTLVPKVDADPQPSWIGENAPVGESDPAFDQITITPKIVSFLTKAPISLVEDGIDFEERLTTLLIRSAAQEIDRVALFGSGQDEEPLGLFGTVGIGEVDLGENGAAITDYDPLLDARELVIAANAPEPSNFIMAPRTDRVIAGLKEATTNAPLARPDALRDARFLVSSVVPVDQTQGTANDASTILTGDFSDLWICVRRDITVVPLRERFFDNLQIGFVTFARVDIAVSRPASFAKVTGIIPA